MPNNYFKMGYIHILSWVAERNVLWVFCQKGNFLLLFYLLAEIYQLYIKKNEMSCDIYYIWSYKICINILMSLYNIWE